MAESGVSEDREPEYRYNAALAQKIEEKWQNKWDKEGTFWAANVKGGLTDGKGRNADGRSPYFVIDMFPYPSGKGLHVGHPLGYIATDVVSRYHRMKGENVLHALGYDAFGLPAEQYAVQTGQHPRITTEQNIANMHRQLHRLGLSLDERRSFATTDMNYVRWTQWIFSRIYDSWYDPEFVRKDGGKGSARPISELVEQFASGGSPARRRRILGFPHRSTAGRRAQRLPPRLRRRGARELVPRPRHRPRQRGGDRRPLRARQPPGRPPPDAPVDAQDHRLRRAPPQGHRHGRLARGHQGDAAQLDRQVHRRVGGFRRARHAQAQPTWRSTPPAATRSSARPTW